MIGNKKILITGVNGFLGSHLAKKLLNHYNIFGLEYSTDNLYRLSDLKIQVFSSNENNLEQLFIDYKFDIVIHTATVYKTSNDSIDKLISTNIILPLKLYELANKYSVSHFINTDSFFNNSNFTYNYLGEYTLSKRHLVEWLKILSSETKVINMKLFHMYGPDDASSKFVSKLINDLSDNVPQIELTPGEQKRDFIYIDDVVEAFYVILNSLDIIKEAYKEFEVGTGKGFSIHDFVVMASNIAKSSTHLIFGALSYRNGEMMEAIANNVDLLKLGWVYKTDINLGIDMLIKFRNRINAPENSKL